MNTEEVAQRFVTIYGMLELKSPRTHPVKSCSKSAEKSIMLKLQGNEKYAQRQDKQALELYSQCIAVAPAGSVELAIGYGNRSAIFFRSKQYPSCLVDVNRALKGQFPARSRAKLHKRRNETIKMIREENAIKEHTKVTLDAVPDFYKNNPLVLELCNNRLEMTGYEFDPIDSANDEATWSLSSFNNKLLPTTSSKVRMEYSERWGRHWIATEDIKPGEILSFEKFFATALDLKKFVKNCSHCFLKSDCLIPCETCTVHMYCGDKCRQEALESYHRVECKLWPYFSAEILKSHHDVLLLRTFLIGTKQGSDLKRLKSDKNFNNVLNQKITFINKRFEPNYLSIISLKKIFGSEETSEMIVLTTKILRMLKYGSYFPNNDRTSLCKTEIFAGFLFLAHLASVKFSTTAVTEVISPATFLLSQTEIPTEETIGAGLCTFHNFINHSCDPNASDVVQRRNHILYAVRPIKAGEQIFISYGPLYENDHLIKRVDILSKHGIVCRCEACSNDWRTASYLRSLTPVFLTRDAELITELQVKHHYLTSAGEKEKVWWRFTNPSNFVFEYRQKLHENVQKPSYMIIVCERCICECMKTKGNCYTNLRLHDILDKCM